MKNIYKSVWLFKSAMIMALVFMLSSCGKLTGPKYAEANEILSWVYEYAYKYDVKNPIMDSEIARDLYDSFYELTSYYGGAKCNVEESVRIANTDVVDWNYNEQGNGDGFDSFFVVYRVSLEERTLYVLVNLLEFDDARYELTVEDIGDYLSDVMANLY